MHDSAQRAHLNFQWMERWVTFFANGPLTEAIDVRNKKGLTIGAKGKKVPQGVALVMCAIWRHFR